LNDPSFFARVNLPSLLFLLIGPALVILFHSDNIGRLFTGKERKIGQKVQLEEHPLRQPPPVPPQMYRYDIPGLSLELPA